MSGWVLILMVFTGGGSPTAVGGFVSREHCERAAQQIQESRRWLQLTTTCVDTGVKR